MRGSLGREAGEEDEHADANLFDAYSLVYRFGLLETHGRARVHSVTA